ncbi:MAG: phenylacetic acid degradation protein PaaN [Propionibacteriales bacterium]|nr:phenylacetic acid degradation protein PaaN [Propionibacteriales bacterium]
MTHAVELFARHRTLLDDAVTATTVRGYYSAFAESPSPRVYGETAAADGSDAFTAYLGKPFPLTTPGSDGVVETEKSPYGVRVGVSYPRIADTGVGVLLQAASAGMVAWRDAGVEARVGVGLEILTRLHARIFELANAVMHTSGQAFVMAFQAGGAHALDRALESIAYAYAEMSRVPATAVWEKPGRDAPIRMEKTFTVVPRGVALVIGCNTFPTWNSWPGLFASLVTGNAVVVKPHPGAVLPLALTVQVCQEVLSEAGYDANLVTLAAEDPADGIAAVLAVRPEVKLIDYTGSTPFGEWLESNARQAVVFTEKSGVNAVVIDSTDSFRGMCFNLAFSLSLYTGQMCTAPQNLFVCADGIDTDEGHKTVDELGAGISAALSKLVGDDSRAVELLGGVVSTQVLDRLATVASSGPGTVVVESREVVHPTYPDAVVRTPAVVRLEVGDTSAYEQECFGPVSYLITTESAQESIEVFRRTVHERGAMTAVVYSTRDTVTASMRSACLDVGVALSENLTGQVFVNQSAAFSDFHGTGANPAANSTYTDGAFVASRFRVVQSRRHI